MIRPRFRFSILSLMLLTTVIAVGVMFYQRHVVWQAALDEFAQLVQTPDFQFGNIERVDALTKRFPELGKQPGAITWAAIGGQIDLCRRFLKAGGQADEGLLTDEPTPLGFAIVQNRRDLAELLIEYGADPHARLTNGSHSFAVPTYLHLAAQYDRIEMCDLLLENKLDVNATNHKGETPLHMAVRGRNVDVVRLLLENKAKSIANEQGQTPLDLANELRDRAVREQNSTFGYDELILQLEDHFPVGDSPEKVGSR